MVILATTRPGLMFIAKWLLFGILSAPASFLRKHIIPLNTAISEKQHALCILNKIGITYFDMCSQVGQKRKAGQKTLHGSTMCLNSDFCNHEPKSFRLATRAHIPDCLVCTMKFCSWSMNIFSFNGVISELTEPQWMSIGHCPTLARQM